MKAAILIMTGTMLSVASVGAWDTVPVYPAPAGNGAPAIIGADGRYLGRLSANPYQPDSTSNPYGRYGSPFSPESINNPYGRYGSPYSPDSARNPYATSPPRLMWGR